MKRRHTVLLIGIVVLWVLSAIIVKNPERSIYSYGPEGVRAFFLLLQQHKPETAVEAWLHHSRELQTKEQQAQGRAVFFLIEPQRRPSFKALLDWVEQGNVLVYAGSNAAASPLLSELGLTIKRERALGRMLAAQSKTLSVQCSERSSDVCSGVRKISTLDDAVGISELQAPDVVAYNGGRPAIISLVRGAGEVWIFFGAEIFSNRSIDKHDNLRFLFQLATRRQRILFDEFSHGYTAPAAGVKRAQQDALMLFTIVLVITLLICVLMRAVRFGPPARLPEDVSAAAGEFASVLGLLYRDHSASEVLRFYVDSWRKRAEDKLAISRRLDDEQFIKEAAAKGAISRHLLENTQAALKVLREAQRYDPQTLNQAVGVLEAALGS